MEEKSNAFLGQERVGKLMAQYAVPCIISLLVGALYNIVDQVFIANAAYLGSYGNAANTVVFPLTVVALAIAVMVGDGCCAFVSIHLGKGQPERANRSVGNAVVMSAASGVMLMAVYLLFQEQILTMFGGRVNEETFAYAKEYFFYITLGIPFYMFGQAMNPILRADGSPRFAMVSTLVGAIANTILDPIFLFIFRWGMMGAAVATVIGQVLTAALSVWYLLYRKTIRLAKKDFALQGSVSGGTLGLGITSFLSQISLVAAMAAGCIPIVGFNMGAGKRDRVRALFTKLLAAEAAVGIVALVLAECFPRNLISLFGAANESRYYTEFAILAFRTYLCMLPLACVNKACFIFLQAMGKAAASMALSMIREVVFGVGFALVLPVFFGLNGVLYSMPVSDALTFLAAVFLIARTYRQLRSDPAPAQGGATPLTPRGKSAKLIAKNFPQRRGFSMPEGVKQCAQNRKAWHDYFIEDKLEAGIELFGTEVKSIRAGKCNLKDSYVEIRNGEAFIQGMHISPYDHGNIFNKDPLRPKKLLLHKAEIRKFYARVMQKGYSIVPLQIYLKNGRVKAEIALARGKKLYDKRDDAAKKEAQRDIDRSVKEHAR